MATCRWQGSVSGDVTVAGNWSGGVPGSGDAAVFDELAVASATAGTLPTTTSITVTDGFKYNIGTSTTPLSIGSGGASTYTTVTVGGRGSVFNVSLVASTTITTMSLNSMVCSVSGAGTITTLNDNVGATISVTALTTLVNARGIRQTVATSATAITTLLNDGNTEITGRAITTALNLSPQSRLTSKGTMVITTLYLADQSTYNKQSISTDTSVYARGRCTITPAGKPALASGNDATTLYRSGEANIILNSGGATYAAGTTVQSAPDASDEGIG